MNATADRRDFDAFLSHAHVDAEFVRRLHRWLTDFAGFSIWYDAEQMSGGVRIQEGLSKGMARSKAALVVATPEALDSGWVKREIEIANKHANDTGNRFRVVLLNFCARNEAEAAEAVDGLSYIDHVDVEEPSLTPRLALEILRAFHPPINLPNVRGSRDVYFTHSWKQSGATTRDVFKAALRAGFRLIGDPKSDDPFDAARIRRIMETCGGHLAILPWRDQAEAQAASGPYRYFLRELDISAKLKLPTLVIAPEAVRRTDGSDADWVRLSEGAKEITDEARALIERFHGRWRRPRSEDYVFFSTDFGTGDADLSGDLRRIVETITGMRTIVGSDLQGRHTQDRIMETISRARLVLADLSPKEPDELRILEGLVSDKAALAQVRGLIGSHARGYNLNVCAEVAMASAFDREIRMFARAPKRRPPFMLQSVGQLRTYASRTELIGLVRALCYPFRRRILNAE